MKIRIVHEKSLTQFDPSNVAAVINIFSRDVAAQIT
jgi:hypothetical protein